MKTPHDIKALKYAKSSYKSQDAKTKVIERQALIKEIVGSKNVVLNFTLSA